METSLPVLDTLRKLLVVLLEALERSGLIAEDATALQSESVSRRLKATDEGRAEESRRTWMIITLSLPIPIRSKTSLWYSRSRYVFSMTIWRGLPTGERKRVKWVS